MELVLASTSPRRKELLALITQLMPEKTFDCVSPDIDESQLENETAAIYIKRLALQKAKVGAVLFGDEHAVVLGSDTIVVVDNDILGKPTDYQDARNMLTRLSGRKHKVMTAVALVYRNGSEVVMVETQVEFCELNANDIDAYIESGEPMDKAGSYGIQGIAGAFVKNIIGSYSAVVGLPMTETRQLLLNAQVLLNAQNMNSK
ncbi:MAG: septum formation inhibitor Maf [Shewanella sp.]|nr:septum formation inhibitor Maf [Shewanella sp.]